MRETSFTAFGHFELCFEENLLLSASKYESWSSFGCDIEAVELAQLPPNGHYR